MPTSNLTAVGLFATKLEKVTFFTRKRPSFLAGRNGRPVNFPGSGEASCLPIAEGGRASYLVESGASLRYGLAECT